MALEAVRSRPQRTSGARLPDMGWRSICQGQIITAKQQNEVTSSARKFLSSGTVRCLLNENVLI
jgi:hypothetical protein